MKRFLVSAGLLLALGLFAPLATAEWGTIKGRIVWDGEKIPEPDDLTALVMKSPDKDFCLKDGKLLSNSVLVNPKNRGFQNTFVWLTNGDPKLKKPLPIHPKLAKPAEDTVEIDQPVCLYMPPAIAVREGQTLVCKNSAKVAHNFLYVSGKLSGNPLLLPGKTYSLGPKDGLDASVAVIDCSCSIHTWMKSYVRVYDHPYYAITDADGSFTIKDAPAGKFNLIAWHGKFGWRGGAAGRTGKVITIEADKTTDVGDLKFAPPPASP